MDTIEIVERDGATTMTLTVRCESQEARAIMLDPHIIEGTTHTYDRLAELLLTLV